MVLTDMLMTATDVAVEAETVAEETTTYSTEALTNIVYPTVRFPHLGIEIGDMTSGFNVFGIHIAWYGVIIAIGIIIAAILVYNLARRTGQNADDYIDIVIACVVFGIIGARLYYVLFSWDYYSAHPGEIINLRNGGLAIYGGIILGAAALAVVCKIKKLSLLRVVDTAVPGVVIAQAIGRWGNFVNKEAFGGYTDNFLAMQIKLADANGVVNDELMTHLVNVDGIKYIQVHPTFLYESLLCLVVFILIMIFRKKARYRGEVALWYFGGYALGRVFIEGLRTDSLLIGHSNIAVSQILAFVIFFASLAILILMRIFIHKDPAAYGYVNETIENWKDISFEKKSGSAKDENVSDATEEENGTTNKDEVSENNDEIEDRGSQDKQN